MTFITITITTTPNIINIIIIVSSMAGLPDGVSGGGCGYDERKSEARGAKLENCGA